jgi:tetratricopeptide (TPR) repeat protein
MPNDHSPAPKDFKGVMVSSTFTDLKEHRAALMDALRKQGLFAIGMEDSIPTPDDEVISSSLKMVGDGHAYIGLISLKYGQTPRCPDRNPQELSVTELEFNKAGDLKRPILVFIMDEDHPTKKRDVEIDPVKIKKLDAFRESAKKSAPGSEIHRVYVTFQSLEDFTRKAIHVVANLRRYLDEQDDTEADEKPSEPIVPEKPEPDPIPKPPAFYAEPAYLGSHEFVGRRDQLETLNEWALPADSHPVLLFEAIGGSGKSLLTWEWVRNYAPAVRKGTKDDWAGRFWYSFYERGAIMADFCQRALAYMTGQPLEELRKKKTAELAPQLLHQLQAQPWLLILDGLERVLVAYHRIDAAQLRDEEAGKTDEIAQRDVCAAIRPEDDELLRALAAAAPSKLLLTSRLIPRVLLNKASQPIPGVQRVPLPGLRPADAEALFRACGVSGDSTAIQAYLKTHCDCHPLTIGVLAGLVNGFMDDRGNFDRWSADPEGGDRLNLADLDLVQKRNHILLAAIAALSPESRQLLSMVALLSEAVDYATLKALNPHLPPEIKEVPVPDDPEEDWDLEWEDMSDEEKEEAKNDYETALQRRTEYERAMGARPRSPEFLAAPKRLAETIKDLESRGLLQYDAQVKHYDLHPVVRGVASGKLAQAEKETYGQRVVDYFSSRPHNSYDQAETLDDVRDGLHVVRTLVQMGRFQEAASAYRGDLENALLFNLETHADIVVLLRPFFPNGWATLPPQIDKYAASALATNAANALSRLGQETEALAAYGSALVLDLELKDWWAVRGDLTNLSDCLSHQNRLSKEALCLSLALDMASLIGDSPSLFSARLLRFQQFARLGRWQEAETMWQSLDPMGRQWSRSDYRPGYAEYFSALARFWRGGLKEEHLARAEYLAREGRNREVIRELHGLRGEWRLEREEWLRAADSLHEAVAMAGTVGQIDATAETQLALAKFRLVSLTDPRHEAEQLAQLKQPAHRALAELWFAIGDREQAKKHALAAYRWAWADGEPFVRRYDLTKSRALLEQLGAEIPNLPPYDPAKDEKLPWEDAVVAAIEDLRAEKAAKAAEAAKTDKE